jgi:hypothetical protein
MKKINEKLDQFSMWFFRIKRKKTTVVTPACMWDKNSFKPW